MQCQEVRQEVTFQSVNDDWDFSDGTMDKKLPANSGDAGFNHWLGRFHTLLAVKPMHHNSWAGRLQLLSCDQDLRPLLWDPAQLLTLSSLGP